MDFRGDPSSALLEVLDPEQNHTFSDHYVEVDFDLSDVMFVATSNSMNIPPALLDRMEVIRLAGYTEDEKLNIAQRYLLPKQQKNNGVKDGEMEVTEVGHPRHHPLLHARGRRALARARDLQDLPQGGQGHAAQDSTTGKVVVTEENLNDFLGVRKFDFGRAEKKNQVGQVVGLAWTEVGGDLLTIEAAVMPGKGNIIRTGSLGDVMKESVEAARSVVRSARPPPGHQGRDVREARHPHPRARRRHAQGRPERRRGDDHGLRVGADRHSGAGRRGDDRRDHAARRSHWRSAA